MRGRVGQPEDWSCGNRCDSCQGQRAEVIKMDFFFFFPATPYGLQDLSSPTRDQTQTLAVKAPSPNHWTAREFPKWIFKEVL